MSDTVEYDLTANYGLKKPWIDADEDVWGTHLNENMDALDTLLKTRGFDASAYLPITGGTVTGDLQVDGDIRAGTTADAGFRLDVATGPNGAARFAASSIAPTVTIKQTGATQPASLFDFGTGALPSLPTTSGAVQLASPDNAASNVRYLADSFSGAANNAGIARFTGRRARGARAAPAKLLAGDIITAFDGLGFDGIVYFAAGEHRLVMRNDTTPTEHSSYWDTTANTAGNTALIRRDYGTGEVVWGSVLPGTEFMHLFPTGNLSLGAATDSGFRLDVTGTARVNMPAGAMGVSPFLVTTSGQPAFPTAALHVRALSLLVNSGTGGPAFQVMGFGTSGPAFVGTVARGTANAPLAISTNDTLMGLWGSAFDGTNWAFQGNMYFRASEPWTATAHGTMIQFGGTSIGTTALNEWARLLDGNLLLGTTTSAGFKLDVVGTGRFSGGLTVTAGGLTVTAGGLSVTTGSTTLSGSLTINSAAATNRQLIFTTASSIRWAMMVNNTAESGANAGSDFQIGRYDDTGVGLGYAFSITRSTGLVTLLTGLSLGNAVAPGGVTDLSRGLAVFSTTYGLNVTSNRLNLVAPTAASIVVNIGGTDLATFNASGITANTITQPAGNETTALASTLFAAKIATALLNVAITDADQTLTIAQVGVRTLNLTGTTTADRTLTFPNVTNQRTWVIRNGTTGGFNTIISFGSGATISIPPTYSAEILWNGSNAGFNVSLFGSAIRIGDATRNAMNIVTGASGSPTTIGSTNGGLQFLTTPLGFNSATPIAKPTVTGAKAGNTALASLCAALVSYGLIADTSTA